MISRTESTSSHDLGAYDAAVVRTLAAVLGEAIDRSDFTAARDLAEQLAHEVSRQRGRRSPR